ncbi:MAG: universal stress protein [Acidobacteria bacterium]|jgi:nucleotide-binding universal stress UspA family protein|nr:universal stress protein [Acidobacteriota bacterium]
MAGIISRKLSNSFEGALAGGGDPATSPLYVFGPFLKLIVVAGVAQVTFGATVWLAVFTVVMVSAMYRRVMTWVTDGSGGSGLAEEEFGSWAVKINAGVTVIEYTLTFLVSMAALVTFIADRFPTLNNAILGFTYRTFLAVALSFVTAWLVNRGPKMAARAFGPATAAILALLWIMVFATIWKTGFHLPDFNLQAFHPAYLNFTFGGYARILALMTGIEIFANLVAAYDGTRAERSRKAFGSLLIIMGTTSITMLIVGPAIFALSDPTNEHVSVFTQTMDKLLPAWASYGGTIIGVAVLLSACAAAAQGIQNLALGLRYRHYVAADLGQRNKYDVAGKPVWMMTIAIVLCFLLFGTSEETYLALYAAGVFILLSMTGWAAFKRLLRELRQKFTGLKLATLSGTAIASFLTSGATIIIFYERFFEGAWSYFLMVPALYLLFNYYRNRLGAPSSVEDRLGSIISEQIYLPAVLQTTDTKQILFKKVIVPLDGSSLAEQVLPTVRAFARSYDAKIEFIAVQNKEKQNGKNMGEEQAEYLQMVSSLLTADRLQADFHLRKGETAAEIDQFASESNADLIVMSTRGKFEVNQLLSGSIAQKVIAKTLIPVLLIRPTNDWRSRRSMFKRILVALDGSEAAEAVLPYIRAFAQHFDSRVLLFSVPEGSESETYSEKIKHYLDDIAATLKEEGFDIITLVTGSGPARSILALSEEKKVDLIMMASHGRGGLDRQKIVIGSVTERVIQGTLCPVFIVPLTRSL